MISNNCLCWYIHCLKEIPKVPAASQAFFEGVTMLDKVRNVGAEFVQTSRLNDEEKKLAKLYVTKKYPIYN